MNLEHYQMVIILAVENTLTAKGAG